MPEMRQANPAGRPIQNAPQPQPPQPPRPRMRLRASIFLVPAAVFLVAWLVSGINPAGTVDDLMNALSVKDKAGFRSLLMLGTVICIVLLVARVLRDTGRRD